MPLRDLQYVSAVLENLIKDFDLYSGTLVKIPSPHFVVFYNGKEKKEDRMVLKLSDAFQNKEKEPQLELLVTMININYGKNKELMDACKDLRDYSIYVAKIRSYMEGNGGDIENTETHRNAENTGTNENEVTAESIGNDENTATAENKRNNNMKYKMTIEEAVERTIDDCIKEGILVDVLTKFRAEVKKLSIFEYNARLHEETLKKEGFEDGREEGREERREQILWNALQKGHTPEQIADFIGIPLEEILKVQESMFQTSPSK